ncbi:helix-turn-helix domain-containing protein [Streptomyces sp. 142MFCol3.1]|uniref:helix-turn-helix domain-containing protein n=1 Tax=Streptomyces sp. 142MFCol3.1 TaxID=1172179 RepID=UPI00049157EA|nr:XRE family transcriptional regulator [Streptomyces sp. 142MFCol3.1]
MRQPPGARCPTAATTPERQDEPFVAELRLLRSRTGLSLAALAARTPYSKSAWHRYLAGTKVPPLSAVEALAALAGAEPGHLRDLHQSAVRSAARKDGADPGDASRESGGHPAGTATAPSPSPSPSPSRASSSGTAGALARRSALPVCILLAMAVAAVVAAAATSGHVSPRSGGVAFSTRCGGASCQGRLPEDVACDRDARTESTVTDTSYAVRLRYSPSCGTAWSEVRARTSEPRELSVRSGQDVLSAAYPGDGPAGSTSPMLAVHSPEGVEACAEVAGKLACTGLDDGWETDPVERR